MNEKALIIIPTYDERENVGPMAEAVLKQVMCRTERVSSTVDRDSMVRGLRPRK